MGCDDAQFYLRFRRPGCDDLAPDDAAALDAHLAACPRCSAVAESEAAFDRAVTTVMKGVPVPDGLRARLVAGVLAKRGAVLRRRAYQYATIAASLFVGVGLAAGLFSANRPKLDTTRLVMEQGDDSLYAQTAEDRVRAWLAENDLPPLPETFDFNQYLTHGTEEVQGRAVPVVVFARPDGFGLGFAKVYAFRSTRFDLDGVREAQGSHCQARPFALHRPTGVTYVVVFTGPDLAPFLRGRDGPAV